MQSTFCSTYIYVWSSLVVTWDVPVPESVFLRQMLWNICVCVFVDKMLLPLADSVYLFPLFFMSVKFKISLILVGRVYKGKNSACHGQCYWHHRLAQANIAITVWVSESPKYNYKLYHFLAINSYWIRLKLAWLLQTPVMHKMLFFILIYITISVYLILHDFNGNSQ